MAGYMTQDPAQAGADQSGAADDSQPDFVVCIACMPDGTYQVYAQDSDDDQDDAGATGGAAAGGDDSGDMSGAGMAAGGDNGDGDSSQTANSIQEALKIAGQMLQEEQTEDAGEDQGGNGNAPVSDPQAVWNQLAKKSDKSRGI